MGAFLVGFIIAAKLGENKGRVGKYQIAIMPGLVAGNVIENPVAIKIDADTGETWFLSIPFTDGWREVK